MNQTVSLEQIIKSIVEEKVKAHEEFSYFQITNTIRERANKGEITVLDCPTYKQINGANVQNIQNSKVKYILQRKKLVPTDYKPVQKTVGTNTFLMFTPPPKPEPKVTDILDF